MLSDQFCTELPASLSHMNMSDVGFFQGFGSGSAWIRINLISWIRIWIQEGKNDPQKKKKVQNFHVL